MSVCGVGKVQDGLKETLAFEMMTKPLYISQITGKKEMCLNKQLFVESR